MSKKFNWGHGLALTLFAFVIFISQFVYRSFFSEEADHKLTSETYYQEGLDVQKEIDWQENANKLENNITTKNTDKGIEIIFPEGYDYHKISGDLKLQRVSNKDIDIITDFKLKDQILLIPNKDLEKGYYKLKVNWSYNAVLYQYRAKIAY